MPEFLALESTFSADGSMKHVVIAIIPLYKSRISFFCTKICRLSRQEMFLDVENILTKRQKLYRPLV